MHSNNYVGLMFRCLRSQTNLYNMVENNIYKPTCRNISNKRNKMNNNQEIKTKKVYRSLFCLWSSNYVLEYQTR